MTADTPAALAANTQRATAMLLQPGRVLPVTMAMRIPD
jgi:hypothetical protein